MFLYSTDQYFFKFFSTLQLWYGHGQGKIMVMATKIREVWLRLGNDCKTFGYLRKKHDYA